MLHDEHLVGAAVKYIRGDTINAEWALRRAVDDIRKMFDSIEDPYLRERRSDVEFVFERVLRNLLGRESGPLAPPPDAVVVAYDLSPADTAQLHKAAVSGLITDAGGKTSHTAIIARAHEIPAVVGLEDITEVVESDDLLLIDGSTGIVIVNPSPPHTVAQYREEQRRQVAAGAQLHAIRDLPARTRDDADIQPLANIDSPDELRRRDRVRRDGRRAVPDRVSGVPWQATALLPTRSATTGPRSRCSTSSPASDRDDPHVRSRRRQAREVSRGGSAPRGESCARSALDPAVPVGSRQGSVPDPAARPAARVRARSAQADVPDDLGRRRAARGEAGSRRRQGRASRRGHPVRRRGQDRDHDR